MSPISALCRDTAVNEAEVMRVLVSPAWWATKLFQEHLRRWAQLQRSGVGAVAQLLKAKVHNNYKGQDRSATGA